MINLNDTITIDDVAQQFTYLIMAGVPESELKSCMFIWNNTFRKIEEQPE